MPIYRAVAPTHPTTSGWQQPRASLRLPRNVPYVVDNLWEFLRPEWAPCRRQAVYASPTPALAAGNASGTPSGTAVHVYEVIFDGACRIAQLRVDDARRHADISAVQKLLQEKSAQLLRLGDDERRAASMLFMPGCSPWDWQRAVEASGWAAEFSEEACARSTFWTHAVDHVANDIGEISFELEPGGRYRLEAATADLVLAEPVC